MFAIVTCMNVDTYKQHREILQQATPKYRNLCIRCIQPEFSCYCQHIQKFDPKIKFLILIHPIEVKRRIATGRMSHLCLENSELITGQDYSHNDQVNAIIQSSEYQSMVLYPGARSLNLTTASEPDKVSLFSGNRIPAIFVIDGTWDTARKTMNQSDNLKSLPRISFIPPGKSQFRVRKQPGENCYSTIEAIHHTIELIGGHAGYDVNSNQHNNLIYVFDKMVERQLEFVRDAYDNPRSTSYRRPKKRIA